MKTFPTIITMFYDIRKMEGSKPEHNRQANKYHELAKNYILTLPYPLVIFIDEDDDVLNDLILDVRKNLLDKTHVYKVKYENTYFYKYVERIKENQKIYKILNGDLNHETPLYITVNNNKFFCVEKTIELNKFGSSHFMWLDFGCNHVAQNLDEIHNWFLDIPDKIRQMCTNPYLENDNMKDFFKYIYHHHAGTLFSGSKENMLKYVELYKKKFEQILDEGWYQIDEAVMTMVQRENPHLFDMYYGDYMAIVCNFSKPIHCIYLVLNGAEKAVNHNRHDVANHILNYLLYHFEGSNNENYDQFYKFIRLNIISNYYVNNRKLNLRVIKLINRALIRNDNNVKNVLICNKGNLEYYENKNLILPFE